MSYADAPAGDGPGAGQPDEEQLRAAYEAQMKTIRVENLILEQAVTLLDFGMRRTGLQPGSEDERDLAQVRLAIEGLRALMPLVEGLVGQQEMTGFREALSRLQMDYVRIGGASNTPGAAAPGGDPPPAPGSEAAAGVAEPAGGEAASPAGGAGPAQSSGRLWIPGQ